MTPLRATSPPYAGTPGNPGNWDAMYNLAMTATNIAAAMVNYGGFSHREACHSHHSLERNGPDPNPAFSGALQRSLPISIPPAPLFIDAAGITSVPPSTSIMFRPRHLPRSFRHSSTWCSRQRFEYDGRRRRRQSWATQGNRSFRKWPSNLTSNSSGNPNSVVVNDAAIELYNPYPQALSTSGMHITDPANAAMDLNLAIDGTANSTFRLTVTSSLQSKARVGRLAPATTNVGGVLVPMAIRWSLPNTPPRNSP